MPNLLPLTRQELNSTETQTKPGLIFQALSTFQRTVATLVAALPYLEARKKYRATWKVPELFYFDATRDTAFRTKPKLPDPAHTHAAQRYPAAYQAWRQLPDLIDNVLALGFHNAALRRALRATPGLAELVHAWSTEHPGIERLTQMLQTMDNETILAVHAITGTGMRVQVAGVLCIAELHWLLESTFDHLNQLALHTGNGPEYREHIPEELRDHDFEPSWQLYRPQVLAMPNERWIDWANMDAWLWGHERVQVLPYINGERVVVLGPKPYPRGVHIPAGLRGIAPACECIERLEGDQLTKLFPNMPALGGPAQKNSVMAA